MRRAGTVGEIAGAIFWLVSPRATYSPSAIIIDVSGGRSIRP